MATSPLLLSDVLKKYYVGKHATISYNTELGFVICTATASYIPMAECQEILKAQVN